MALIRSNARRKRPRKMRDLKPKSVARLLRPATKPDEKIGQRPETDPFKLIQIEDNKNYPSLISHYYSVFYDSESRYSSIRPAYLIAESLDRTLSDPVVLHIGIAHVFKGLYNLAGRQSCPEYIYHMNQTLEIVNRRIANSHQKSITNTTILAVVSLATFELRSGSNARIKVHLNGIEAMIKNAGGLSALFTDRFLMRNIHGMDITTAIITGLRPRFEMPYRDLNPNLDTILCTRYKVKLSNLTGLQDLSQQAVKVHAMLRHLIMDKEMAIAAQKITADAEFDLFVSSSQYLLYQLIPLVQYNNSASPTPGRNTEIFRLLGLAGLAHIFVFTFKLPRSQMRIFISTQIRASLETIDMCNFQFACPEMMLWIILVGGLASEGTAEEAWFIKTLAKSCCSVGIVGRVALSHFLSEFLWSDFYLGLAFKDFWYAVTVAQTG
ncbi:hypothetical protein N431DRAFT_366976 [Stipitochalara longipes BDJ]|nr:hypothetical protein N431DRAFT_366976 [Stipitochalara longipes BDJ]